MAEIVLISYISERFSFLLMRKENVKTFVINNFVAVIFLEHTYEKNILNEEKDNENIYFMK